MGRRNTALTPPESSEPPARAWKWSDYGTVGQSTTESTPDWLDPEKENPHEFATWLKDSTKVFFSPTRGSFHNVQKQDRK